MSSSPSGKIAKNLRQMGDIFLDRLHLLQISPLALIQLPVGKEDPHEKANNA